MENQTEQNEDRKQFSQKDGYFRKTTLAGEVEFSISLIVIKIEKINAGRKIDFDEEVRNFEIQLIERALRRTDGNQARAARLLNLKPTNLHQKIKRYATRGLNTKIEK